VVLAGELLESHGPNGQEGSPTVIIDGYRAAQEEALKILDDIAIKVKPKDKETLKRVAKTTMSTKLVSSHSGYLSEIAVDAVLQVAEEANGGTKVDLDMIKVEKKPGGSMTDTVLVKGLIIDKEVAQYPSMFTRRDRAARRRYGDREDRVHQQDQHRDARRDAPSAEKMLRDR
jgi:chaperonin GroEL (HSP60 family)